MSEKSFSENEQDLECIELTDETGQFELIDRPALVKTGEVSLSLGVIIYDPASKQAIVGSFLDSRDKLFDQMMANIVSFFNNSDLSSLEVYVGGLAPHTPNNEVSVDETREKRQAAKQKLHSLPGFNINNINIQWAEPYQHMEMSINTETGQVFYSVDDPESDSDFEYDD